MEEIKVKLVREPRLEYNAVTTPTLAVNMVKDMIGDLDRENFILVNLDNAGKPVNYNVVSIGNEHQTSISISNIMRATILAGSTNIMVFHNHPSGNLNPSDADIAITNKLIAACKLMDIKLIDHIIVSYTGHYSFKNNNLLNDNLDAYKVKQLLFEEIKEPNFNYGGEQIMKTKGLTKEEALQQLDLINKTIEFNNYINKEARKYMKETGLDKTFNGWHDSATPEMINMMQGFLDEADFMSESTKLKYLEDTSAIFGEKWSIAQNRNLLKDRKDCETFLKTFERAENNAEEENALFRVERNTETTRMNLYFDGKPEEEVRNVLKHNGFKWSPHYSCWTRQLTENAEYSLKRVKEQLKDKIDSVNNEMLHVNMEEAHRVYDGLFNVTEPQEIANEFNKLVQDENGTIYKPKENTKLSYEVEDMERVTAQAENKGYNVKSFNYETGEYVAEKQGVIAKYDINGKEQKFTLDELNELKKNAWQRTSEVGATDKDVEISLFYDKLIEQYNDKFTILKEYPNVDYVLARNNNLEAPEPYVAAHYYNEETKSWGQGHYFTNMDDAFDYLNEVEKDWLKNVDPDALLNTIRDKLNSEEIKTLENSIYNKNDSGKEI